MNNDIEIDYLLPILKSIVLSEKGEDWSCMIEAPLGIIWQPWRSFHSSIIILEPLSKCSHLKENQVITTIFCTWHDSYAVVYLQN